MKAHSRVLLAALALALFCPVASRAADEKKDDGAKDKSAAASADLKKLQGEWTTPSAEEGKQVSYTFKGDKVTVKAPSRTYQMTVVLDPAAKPHATVDFKIDAGPEDAKGQTTKGIYKFEGEKFVFCIRPEGERPEKFEQVGGEQFLVELKHKAGDKDSGADSK